MAKKALTGTFEFNKRKKTCFHEGKKLKAVESDVRRMM